jgi:nucleoside-diphosphate-sugar epimerase
LLRSQVPLPLAAFRAVRSLIGIRNLVSLIELAITRSEAANEVFVAADTEEVTLPQLLRHLGDGLGVNVRLLWLPVPLVEGLAAITGQHKPLLKLTASLRVDASKARRLLGWQPNIDTVTGLREAGSSFARRSPA